MRRLWDHHGKLEHGSLGSGISSNCRSSQDVGPSASFRASRVRLTCSGLLDFPCPRGVGMPRGIVQAGCDGGERCGALLADPERMVTRLPAKNSDGGAILVRINWRAQAMGHPTFSRSAVRQRNEEIVAYANQHPEVTNTALGLKYDLSRETIRLILDRDRRRTERNKRLEAKTYHWGFRGH